MLILTRRCTNRSPTTTDRAHSRHGTHCVPTLAQSRLSRVDHLISLMFSLAGMGWHQQSVSIQPRLLHQYDIISHRQQTSSQFLLRQARSRPCKCSQASEYWCVIMARSTYGSNRRTIRRRDLAKRGHQALRVSHYCASARPSFIPRSHSNRGEDCQIKRHVCTRNYSMNSFHITAAHCHP